MPGLIIEHIDPNFAKHCLSGLPYGVVIISGTNGKTTTTKMVVELLQSQGLRVFTNRTGSNFMRGVIAALLGEVDVHGNLHADIAVLELDEAHAVKFAEKIPPKYSMFLNVMRDQLDRFGEIDHTAQLLKDIAMSTTDTVILNREDYRVAEIAKFLKKQKIKYFGLDKGLVHFFPNDDDLHNKKQARQKSTTRKKADVVLQSFSKDKAVFVFDNKEFKTKLKLNGIYNVFNAAAAISLVRTISAEKFSEAKLKKSLPNITPAFGRGERVIIDGQPLEIVLVKNPAGFQLGLESFDPNGYATMIAINDNYADGRDMSWLWDVDFSSLQKHGVQCVSGIRAYDMALRLRYDEVTVKFVKENIKNATAKFIRSNVKTPKRIYCTYTAMLTIRKKISRMTKIERAIK